MLTTSSENVDLESQTGLKHVCFPNGMDSIPAIVQSMLGEKWDLLWQILNIGIKELLRNGKRCSEKMPLDMNEKWEHSVCSVYQPTRCAQQLVSVGLGLSAEAYSIVNTEHKHIYVCQTYEYLCGAHDLEDAVQFNCGRFEPNECEYDFVAVHNRNGFSCTRKRIYANGFISRSRPASCAVCCMFDVSGSGFICEVYRLQLEALLNVMNP